MGGSPGGCEELWPKCKAAPPAQGDENPPGASIRPALLDFVERLAHVAVLDPACGSGNFLYVAIHLLLDLEKEVIAYGARRGLTLLPQVHPRSSSA